MLTRDSIKLYSVPPIWPEDTFVILGCGPSLSEKQINHIQGNARVIAVNASYLMAPWADVLYATDAAFWRHYADELPEYCGVRIGLAWDTENDKQFYQYHKVDPAKVRFMQCTGELGLEDDRTALRHGNNSGYAAINLAVHLGAKRIVLLGYDMQSVDGQNSFPGYSPARSIPDRYEHMLKSFDSLLEPLEALEIKVFNATPDSALDSFPHVDIMEVV